MPDRTQENEKVRRQKKLENIFIAKTAAEWYSSVVNTLLRNLEETNMADADFITLEYDDGTELECEILGVFDAEGKEYIALFPQDGSDDVYIYGYKEVGEEEFELIDIEDDSEFEKAVAVFDELMLEE